MIRKSKKMAKVRQNRIDAYSAMTRKGFSDSGKQQRLETGGYRCPGSFKRT